VWGESLNPTINPTNHSVTHSRGSCFQLEVTYIPTECLKVS